MDIKKKILGSNVGCNRHHTIGYSISPYCVLASCSTITKQLRQTIMQAYGLKVWVPPFLVKAHSTRSVSICWATILFLSLWMDPGCINFSCLIQVAEGDRHPNLWSQGSDSTLSRQGTLAKICECFLAFSGPGFPFCHFGWTLLGCINFSSHLLQVAPRDYRPNLWSQGPQRSQVLPFSCQGTFYQICECFFGLFRTMIPFLSLWMHPVRVH